LLASYPDGHILHLEQGATEKLFPGVQENQTSEPAKSGANASGQRNRDRKALFDIYPHILELFQRGQDDPQNRAKFRNLFSVAALTGCAPIIRHSIRPSVNGLTIRRNKVG